MKTKKLKSTKCGSNRRKVPSDVSPTTSLPPLVEGQLRCFLRVTVSRVLWTVPKPSPTTFIRLRWWGESSNGTQFRPRDGSQTAQKTVKSTARFPIRCGPKQFTSYLTDMGSLVLEVLTKPEHLPIARAQVAGISCLSLSHSISGFFTLVSPTSEKLGELQVSLALEALTETYDSSCSVPTTDMSIETAVSAFRSTVKPASQPNILVVPSLSRPLSVNSGKESGSNTPRGKDHLYFQNAQTEKKTDLALENQKPTSIRSQHGQGAANPTVQESTQGQTTNDILSVILERGSKLRNAMVVSALKSDMDSELALKDTPLPLPKDNIGAPPMPSIPPCGRLLQNILHADSSLLQSPHSPPDFLSPDCTAADTENRAVDLLLGSLNGSALPIWDGEGSPPDSFLSVYGDSELNDPQYDQSLLENLFYKAPMSNSGPSDDDKDGPSPRKNLKKRGDDEELRHSGPKKSGGLDSEDVQTPGTGDMLPGLCMDQLTVLGEVRLARVVIHSLTVPTDSTTITPKKISGKGKPPRPLSKKCSYFVEYLFPVASSRHDRSQAMAAEVTRVFSSKVTGGVVNFQQRSVFPVHFSGSTIEQWWGTELTFNIYSRKSSQKKPVAIGKAVFPLRFLLQREQLSQTIILPVQSLQGPGESQYIGPLKVSLELAADNKDFSSANGQRSDGAGSRTPSHALTSHLREASPSGVDMTTIRPQHHDTRGEDIPLSTVNSRNSRTRKRTVAPQGPSPLTSLQTSHHRPQAHQVVEEEDSEVLLHALLMVPNGKDFSCGPMQPPNVYLNCKLFGQDETSRSVISWGQTNPSFNFVQVAPVALTSRLLERMRNNVMVIEVWQRAGSSGQDRLLGLVKLPLHQFYMSFRDPKISQLLLQAQYPVLGVDSYMPVIDVFSGIIKGNLRVLLAMGLSVQIVSLQRMRDEELGSVSHLPRPAHLLDHQPPKEQNVKPSPEEAMREHLFVVKVERVKGLTPLQSTVWGEADCYVQYTFPTQEEPPAQSLDPNLLEGVNLRQFRTTTTLCVPDPVFGHSESHVLLAPVGVPVQRLLLSSFSSQGLANGGGIPFEVWCRYYYPNVRDQLVAKGMLPLSKLCAMVTMQRQQPTEAQVFSLPLMPRTDSPAGHQPQPSGLLDVFVHYKQRPLRSDVRSGTVASQVVTMVVQVHRAAGLQAAARALSEQDETFQYYADVGVNVYVTAQLSFLPESERRSTRVAARTFCPEFDHHTEFPCELQVQRSSGETCSLAELLQEATAVFTVWNRDSRKVMVSPRSKNTLLGTVRIQLADLIHKRTGISGWFGVSLPKDLTSSPRHHIFVGGLDISINFAHHADRERVVTAAQVLGWEVGREEEEPPNEGETWAETRRTVSLTVSMPRAWLPVHCLLLPGHSELQRSTYCYFRYKLYDGEAFCSQLRHPGLSVEEEGGGGEEGLSTVAFRGSRTVELRSSQPLLWYLREERLEIQVWVAFGKDRRPRPHDMDRLVGSAFVDLSSLAKMARHKLNLSGVYPLFRRSAPDLSGAALRVHITLTPGSLPEAHTPGGGDSQDQENCDSQGEEEEGGQGVPSSTAAVSRQSGTPSRHQTKSSMSVEPSQPSEVSMEDTFTVTITVDRAMHLSLKGCPLAERSGGLPSCCVSYVMADSAEPVTTALIADSHCPVWDHHQECRLSKQLLLDPQQSLVFKVWHKGDVERVIGFASVDLSPLLSGFQSVCGWYNITDFNGQCQGQLKVSVSPLKGVQELRGQRQAVCEDGNKDSSALFQTLPLYYHTTATYSSFPSHVSRYTEQKINSTPNHLDRLLPERSSESDRHDEHMDRVRLYHQSLQEGGVGHPTSAAAGDAHPSSSVLFSALRKNLSELDDIQRYFSHKLSIPTFPSQSEQGQLSRLDEHQVSDTDSSQLLLKSTRLVGEVNNLISGLQGHHRMETIPSSPQNSSTTPPVPDDHHLPEGYEAFPQSAPCFHKASGSPQEDLSPVPSPVPCMYQEHSDSQADEEEEGDKAPASEDDEGGGPREEEEEDGDYEETVVEPRPLNEVTSLTDRTSPWTSLLSDPDLASLESLETPEEHQTLDYSYHPSLTQQEGERETLDLQTDTLQAWSSSEPIGSRRGEEREQHVNSEFFHGPDTDEEDTVSDGERTLQTFDNEAALHQETITAALHKQSLLCSGETASRVPGDRDALSEVETSRLLYDTAAFSEDDTEHVVTSDTYQPETFLHKEDNRKSKHSDPVEIPNFFLSSHHMEASMRALRIAPVFPLASSDPKKSSLRHGILCRRVPRPRPNIPPSSMKKEETKRIAKIFASHFKD